MHSAESAREAAVEADVAARLARVFVTPTGLSWRQQLAAAVRKGEPPPKPAPATGQLQVGLHGLDRPSAASTQQQVCVAF